VSIYPTKTNKVNIRNKKLKAGISLVVLFSLLLITLAFDFFHIFTIIVIGSIGLLIYPICLFLITLGILMICDKKIKTSKATIVFCIFWIITFVLILHLATCPAIDDGFANYIKSTFKSCNTAGGVLFGLILYPLYYFTYNVASYIILSVILVVLTALIIDKLYFEFKNLKILKSNKLESVNDDNAIDTFDEEDDDDEIEEIKYLHNKVSNNIEEDIFIADEDDSLEKNNALSKLGLSDNNKDDNIDYISKLDSIEQSNDDNKIETTTNKPNIFVHEDDFVTDSHVTKVTSLNKKEEEQKQKAAQDEIKRKEALEYLRISSGKFETKIKEKGLDNVKPLKEIDATNNSVNLEKQKEENLQRLSNLSSGLFGNNTSSNGGFNPFKNRETSSNDLYDSNLSKDSFKINNLFDKNNNSFNSNYTEQAKKVYTGETKDNLVNPTGPRPVQVSMETITPKSNIQQKIYKKPPQPYNKPPLDLLKKYAQNIDDDAEYIAEKGNLIVETLRAFKIETKIINATKGPTFTRYELQMAPGVSVNLVNGKINDLSMVLESECRVQVPIPGKNAFGVEVPNKKRTMVGLREILESANFQNSKSPLTFALGKDITADCKVACIDKLVHTLVAGSTGSGKSVCLNTLLASLLYKASPEDLRLLLVDPKQVEFSMFNNLPHMLIPKTITECEMAVDALSWLVDEMDRRYKKLSMLGVKKISEYNETQEVMSGSVPKMFYIVMIFDEVGDFMVRAKKEIEEKIKLLAAKSRACGIHLILATQRPTVDVITGTIKANLPSRISFAVNSYNDSKTILECSGAEYLLGQGDMLYLPQGTNDPQRIQGCFVDNKELMSVIKYVTENNEAEFDEEIENQMFNKNDGFNPGNSAEEAFDPMLKDCLKFFIKTKKASASSLQANFGIGYPKANKIVVQMEKAGFISPGDSNGRRTLYTTPQEFEERFGENIDD